MPAQDYHRFGGIEDPHTRVHTKQFNAPIEVMPMVIETAIYKTKYKWDQLLILGIISGGKPPLHHSRSSQGIDLLKKIKNKRN